MRILLEGIGGVGGVIAGELIRAGIQPALVTGNTTIADAINQYGLRVTTPRDGFSVHARAFAALDQAADEGPFDVALLSMKANGVVDAAAATAPLLTANGFLVTCQNGIVEDAVSREVGAERVVAAIIGWGATMHGPGVYERTGPGKNHLGEIDGRVTPRVQRLADLLEPSAPTVVSENIRGALWAKLGINCTITSGGALTGQALGAMLRHRAVRSAFLGIYREVMDTARALGVQPERIAADPWLLYLPRDAGAVTRRAKDLLMRAIGLRYQRVRSSSLQSLERGRPTEVAFLNGYVVEQARTAGVEVPLNAAVTRMITEIERGQRHIDLTNMDELLAASR
jgi:2-dehydropantoate 2-reductase